MTGAWVGAGMPRKEDRRLLAGRGRFVADLAGPGTLHAAFLRSTQARAKLLSVDVSEASRMPGVHAVLTGRELAERVGPLSPLQQPEPGFVAATELAVADPKPRCLAVDRVDYVGQPIAVVVADDRHLAEDALEAIEVDYRELAAVTDPERALDEGAELVHPGLVDNQAGRIRVAFGDVQGALERAEVVVTETFRMGRHGAVPLECRGVLARVDPVTERLELVTSSQIPHQVRKVLCTALGLPESDVRVRVPDVGGGFGTKANVYAEEIVLAELARRLRREVIWVEDRAEHLTAAAQGRDQVHHVRLAVAADGRILSWESDFLVDIGAGSLWTAGIVSNTAIHLMGPYRIDALRVHGRAVFTNKAIVAQYRGAGRPEACFALERALDLAARRLGVPATALRERNLLTDAELPYRRPVPYRDGVPIVYDGGNYLAVQRAAERAFGADTLEALRAQYPDRLVGYGVANYLEATGRGPWESARAELTAWGGFDVVAGSASAGQGHETTFAQVAADVLGVPPDQVRVRTGDTGLLAHGIGTFASRSAVLAGSAVHLAAARVVEQGRQLAALALGAPDVVFRDGGFEAGGFEAGGFGGGGRRLSWAELAALAVPGGKLDGHRLPASEQRFRPDTVTWTMGTHAVAVLVDPETGLCTLARYVVAHEGGTEINPVVVRGQVQGGVAQGIGGALLEQFRYSPDGQPLSSTFADYHLPGTCDVPVVRVVHHELPTSSNPIGVRGVGESGTIAAYAAIASAIEHALGDPPQPVLTSTPIEPKVVLAAVPARELVGALPNGPRG